jgi:four helix bundle protein
MIAYEKLDAWKVCHQLTLGVYEATKPMLEPEPDLAHQLRLAALLAAAKLARGAGTGSRVMFRQCAEMSVGHLSEVRYYLNFAHVMGFVSDQTRQKLDALRGRASFYIWKHLCPEPPRPDSEAPVGDDTD